MHVGFGPVMSADAGMCAMIEARQWTCTGKKRCATSMCEFERNTQQVRVSRTSKMTPDKFKGRHKESGDSTATYHLMVNG
jgi:hypothetical protein